MEPGEEVTKPGSSLLESMLTLDSTAQLPRASPMNTVSQAASQALSKSWGSNVILAEDASSGASNVTVRLPIHTVSTSFGVLGSGSLSLKKSNVVGRPMKTDLSGVGRVLTQRKNPSVKLKHLSSSGINSMFGGSVKGLKKSLEDVSVLSQSPTRETTSADITGGPQMHTSDSIVDLASDPGANGSTGGGDSEVELIEETWPGKVCAFCNLGERSQLGQGEMLRLEVGSDFESLRQSTLHSEERLQSLAANVGAVNTKTSSGPGSVGPGSHVVSAGQPSGIKKPRLALKGRRTSSFDASQSFRSELQEELNGVGYTEEPDLLAIVEPCGYFYAHRMCAMWSKGVKVVDETNPGQSVVSVCSGNSWPEVAGADSALIRAASLRCHSCGSFGASLSCQHTSTVGTGCQKSFHFPCAVSCGAFLNAKTRKLHCPDHMHQGSIVAGPTEANCAICHSPSNVTNQLFCVTCGKHYHGSCVGLGVGPGVRTAWQCNECKVCITCRTPATQQGIGTEAVTDRTKMLVCDTCDKNYHPSCVRPLISNIPKLGWKCKNCRVCGDCGSRTPGSGPSSRWHACFTVCDSCYQQRNKGVCCPLCGKAYRHSQREMSQCQRCRKYVHSGCDPEADRMLVQRKKDMNSDYEYLCPPCKVSSPLPNPKTSTEMDATFSESNPGSVGQDHSQQMTQQPPLFDADPPGTPTFADEFLQQTEDMKPLAIRAGQKVMASQQQSAGKIARKRMAGTTSTSATGGGTAGRPKGSGKAASFGAAGSNSSSSGAAYNRKANKLADFGRKRGPKPKMRGVFGAPGVGLQRPTDGTSSASVGGSTTGTINVPTTAGTGIEGEPCLENKLILCSSTDSFVVEQDACAMCGSFGLDQEGRLISCAQCGQCYHPFCANVKVTKVILQKGWRCLDCTVCEGCGDRHDEARLLLCDECDISYHIYCMEPPLDYVPQGNWKCKWCAVCHVCGSNEPGVNANWTHQANASLCGPCASMRQCPSCTSSYNEGELIIQCQQCSQWLHAGCDLIRNEREAEFCAEDGYTCMLCRPADQQPPHLHPCNASAVALALAPPASIAAVSYPAGNRHNRQSSSASPPPSPVAGIHDPVGSLANGSSSVRPKSSAAGQFLVDGISLSEGGMNHLRSLQFDQPRRRCRNKKSLESDAQDEIQPDGLEVLDPLFKDGTILTPREDGRMPDVPEGYAIVHGDNGVLILRKKRQRNLQKLGIGGFQVRRPWARVKDKEEDAMDNYNTAEVTLQQLKDVGVTIGTQQTAVMAATVVDLAASEAGNKPKRKPQRRKAKNKLVETYPTYLQEAFFGRDLLIKPANSNSNSFLNDSANDSQTARASGSDSEPTEDVAIPAVKNPSIIYLSKEEVADMERRSTPVAIAGPVQQPHATATTSVQSSPQSQNRPAFPTVQAAAGRPAAPPTVMATIKPEANEDGLNVPADNDEEEEEEALKDILPLAGDLLADSDDLVDSIMKETDVGCNVHAGHSLELEDSPRRGSNQLQERHQSDELSDILLNDHLNLETIEVGGLPNMDCKDVEDIFKGVLTDESQESQSADFTQMATVQQQEQQQHSMSLGVNVNVNNSTAALMPPVATGGAAALVRALSQQQSQQGTASPNTNIQQPQQQPPPCSPYFSEYSSSPGFSPAFSEPPQSPWPSSSGSNVGMTGGDPHGNDLQDRDGGGAGATANQRNALKWEADEALGLSATISAVLFANTNHPELKRDFPAWTERWKQIAKIWRSLPGEKKAPFLQKARENRAAVRLQKTHHQQQTQQSTADAATPTLQRNISSASSSSPGPELPSPSNSSSGSSEQLASAHPSLCQRVPPVAAVTVADSMAPTSCCFSPSSSSTIVTTIVKSTSMQLADEETATEKEDPPICQTNVGVHHVESHGIRVLTPSEIMRTLPSIGNAANNNVQQHPNAGAVQPAVLLPQHIHLHPLHHYVAHHPVGVQQQQMQLHRHHSAEMEKPVMAIPRRGVVETEQERQWKQLQAQRQQQQQQQQQQVVIGGVPLGGHIPVSTGSMAIATGQPEVMAQHQQQQQPILQQPVMPSQQLGGSFATPIQVSRVRAPGEPVNVAAGQVFMLRGPGNPPVVQQQTAATPAVVSTPDGAEIVDASSAVVVDPSRPQLRDLLQRQHLQQQQQHRPPHFIKSENIKREDDGNAMNAQQHFAMQQQQQQQQQRPQFRYPLPPSAAGPNVVPSQGPVLQQQQPMQGTPRMMSPQQHMQMQMQQQPRPRGFQPGSAEFRQPIHVVHPLQQQQQQQQLVQGHLGDPRMRMMMMQQQQMQMQRPVGPVQQQQLHPHQQQEMQQHTGGIRQMYPGPAMLQQQANVHPMAMQQPLQHMQQQQPIMQQPMKVEMIHEEPPTPCVVAVSAESHNLHHQQHDPADDDFGDLGLVDDDELLGLGNDFNILEYADPELHDAMDDVMGGGQDDHPGHRSSSSAGNGAGGSDSPSDFNILEYADPGELDGTSTTTADEGNTSQRSVNEQLTPDELSRRKKEEEEKAAKVAQDMNEFQAKLLELTEQKKQQQLKAEAEQQQQQQNAQHHRHHLQGPDGPPGPGMQQQPPFGVSAYPQQASQPPPPYRGPPPPYPGTPRAPSSAQLGYGCMVRPGVGGGNGGHVVHGCSPNGINSPVYLVSPPLTPSLASPSPVSSLPAGFHHHQQMQQQQQQQQQRRSLLLQEQPLLLEDLLEQEKRELQRQHMQHQQHHQQQSPVGGGGGMPFGTSIGSAPIGSTPEKPFLSDTDFEKLKADVLAGGPSVSLSPPSSVHPHLMQQQQQPQQQQMQQHHMHQQHQQHIHVHQGQQHQQQQLFQHPHAPNVVQHQQMQQQQTMQMHRPQGNFQSVHPHMVNQQQPFIRAGPPIQQQQQQQQQQQWHVHQQRSPGSASVPPADPGLHPALLQSQSNATAPTVRPPLPPALLPAMAAPSENVTNEAERQQQLAYEQWLVQQQHLIRQHQVYYETEVSKLRKQRKSLNSRQRQLRKNNQELNDADAGELDRITTEQQGLQKQLDQVRRQARQHTMLLQDYRTKQQKRQGVVGAAGQQLPASPSPLADGSANFGTFGQPQQLQLQIQQQGQQQHAQQASPRGGGMVVGGRAGTPQSPHPLLSPVGHMGMTGPLRPPMTPQQQGHPQMHGQMMQQQPGNGNMMVMMNPQQQHGPNASSPHAGQQHQQNHSHMGMQQPGQQMMMQPNRNIGVGQQAQFQQVRQQQQQQQQHAHGSPMCPSSPQVATSSSGGPVQSPRMIHQVASPAQMTPQPSPSPQMQMPGRVAGQGQQQQQQQRPMPAPSPSPSMMMSHSPHGSIGGPMTPGPMTPGGAGQQQQPSPMPSPHTASGGGSAGPVNQQGQMQTSSSSPRAMGQQQVGTPLSQHSENNDVVALNSPFSPGPMASPQPVGVMGQPGHNPNVVGAGQGPGGMAMRLTSPQSHPPRLPSPQQQQQQMQNVPQNVAGGGVRMMGHPGPGVMIRQPIQQQYVDQMLQQQHQHQQMQQQGGPGQVMMQRPPGNMQQQQQQQQHMVMQQPGQQMVNQQRFVRPANVIQQQSGGQVQVSGGEPVMMIRQRFPMASALQHQAAQIQQQQQHAPMQPNMQAMQQQQPMKVNQQQAQQQQAQMQMQRQQQLMQQQQQQQQFGMQQMQQQQPPPQHQMHQQGVQGQLNHQQQQGHFQPQQQTFGNNAQPMQQQQYNIQQQSLHHQPMQQQQQQVYGGNNNNYNAAMRPRAPGTPVTVQQQLSVDSSGGSVAPSPLQSPAGQQPVNQTNDPTDPSAGGGGGGGGIGSANVAPYWLVYDSFGFPKIGLKGGGTDGPLSPHPVPIIPEAKKTTPVIDVDSSTSSEGVGVEISKPEEVVSETLIDPLATPSTDVVEEVHVVAATEETAKSEEVETLQKGLRTEKESVEVKAEVEKMLSNPADSGDKEIQDPIELEQKMNSSKSCEISAAEFETNADPVVTLIPSLAPLPDKSLATTISSPLNASDKSADPEASAVPVPDVMVNEAKAHIASAEMRKEMNVEALLPAIKQESQMRRTSPVETCVVLAGRPVSTPPGGIVSTVSVPLAVTLASKVSLKTFIPKSSSPSVTATVTTVTLSAVPITTPIHSSGVTQSHPPMMSSVPMTSVRTVSVPTSILVRAPVGNRLTSPHIARPLPTLTLNPLTSAPQIHPHKMIQVQQQTQVVVKQEKADEEQVTATTQEFTEESNPLLVQQQQQNALLKQLLQGSAAAAAAAAAAASSASVTAMTTASSVSSTTSNLMTTTTSTKPTSLMGLLAKPLTPSKVAVSSSISSTNYSGGIAMSSSGTSAATSSASRSLFGAATSLASQLAQPITPSSLAVAQIPPSQMAQMVSRVPQPPTPSASRPASLMVRTPFVGQQQRQVVVVKQEVVVLGEQAAPSSGGVKIEQEESEHSMDSVTALSTSEMEPSANRLPTHLTTVQSSAATSEEIRKMKRRQYQQKRRQSVANNKPDASANVAAMNVLAVTVPTAVSLNPTIPTVSVAVPVSGHPANTPGSAPVTPTGSAAVVSLTPNPTAKKRSRKGSKYDEIVDYDAFIDSVMTQIRTALPPLTVQEPQLGRGCVSSTGTSVFGAGDLTPFASRIQNNNYYGSYSTPAVKIDRNGLLKGCYGSAHLPGFSDYYNTRPFGDVEPVVAPANVVPPPVNNTSGSSNQRGFYHQEFAWPRWDPAGSSRHHDDYPSRNSRSSSSCSILLESNNTNVAGGSRGDGTDTPDTVVSSSSPECVMPEPIVRFPGLRFIDLAMDAAPERHCKSPEDSSSRRSSYCNSPDIPIIICAPVPIRPALPVQPAVPALQPPPIKKELICLDTENQPNMNSIQSGKTSSFAASAFGLAASGLPLRDSTNVTVTLTLNASAAEDVNQVLCRLAALLRVPPPTDYRIVERPNASAPGGGGGPPGPSQRLGLYRFKGKDGKEGAPVDIQSILNGTAKFCRHCDVVILGHNNKITKKAQLFSAGLDNTADPKKLTTTATIADPNDPDGEEEDYHFCSSACFVQFAVAHNARPSAIEAKEANAVVAHISSRRQVHDAALSSHSHTAASAAAASVVAAAAAAAAVPVQTAQSLVPVVPVVPKWKGIRYRNWSPNCQLAKKQQPGNKKMTENELTEMLYRAAICIRPSGDKAVDKRQCLFCYGQGDGVSDGPARLINYDVDRWVHLNCALWHEEVFEMVNGALMNVDTALKQSLTQTCIHCGRNGASVKCFKLRCSSVFHLGCAIKEGCVFLKNKSVYCSQHLPKCSSTSSTSVVDIKEEQLTTLSVFRRVYINRDENRQVATVMHSGGVTGPLLDAGEQSYLLRVGSLTFLSVGQLLPHQLAAFHSSNCIYPIGYQVVRFYWSPRQVHKRCRYVCSIEDCEGRPQFNVVVQEPNLPDLFFKDWTCQGVWQQILGAIEEMRRQEGVVRLFPQFLNGEDLFGLNEPAIVRVLESLPGIESLTDYNFKYGRNPLLELPLAVNPTGSARSEPKLRTHVKRFHAQRTTGTTRSSSNSSASSSSGGSSYSNSMASSLVMVDLPGPYSKQFVHSKSSQYKKMKQEWRHNIYLARSKIQGLGLYAARDIEKHTMVIEYIGEMIRAELAECREKRYEAANRGIYMFRLDEQRVIDATLCGGLARYINHSCGPNCVAEAVEVERDLRIIIFASRRISRGEELSYDYKFDIEDDHKIPCLCGASSCRKWMN